ncbi:MAG: cytochrome c biogenesis protein ResB [Neisseria sp.]|uniref:cytochrome c biogenesis protein ResB n=1 Tax=Neisseria sp. TaxID=192066 RepID=UPI0026DD8040|nr:cytochrome c biogenesis protein ResB [Neisseria sp.]MDO4641331.1 cytochrome c biogenesis protein ResB [Neisseria sp.]
MNVSKKTPLIRWPWFAFLSSMRFAVALLSVLGIASIIGTVLQQNQQATDYVVKFGPFWSEIFRFLGLYDVYASSWFVLIMLFLVLSTGLCLWRNIPPFMREMKSFRLKAKAQSLAAMRHSVELAHGLTPEVAARYLEVQGFAYKMATRDDGSIIVAAKKGSANKWGYICAHAALIVICLGGLIDSNLLLKLGVLTGRVVPDETSVFAKDFKPESVMGQGNLSFRGNVNITEGQTADVVFLNADKGMLVQDLPFSVTLKKFHIDFYNTGMPKDFASDLVVVDKKTGARSEHTIRVNHPLTVDGVTVYQASFADGGSELKFKAWDLASPSKQFVRLGAKSMAAFPLNLAEQKYQIEFGQFTAMNVEDMSQPAEKKDFRSKLNDVRAVQQEKRFTNIGPSVVYRLRDSAGQALEYKNYMLPIDQGGSYFFITGARQELDQQYRWLRIPADAQGKMDTFMTLRELINDGGERGKIVARAALSAPQDVREQFGRAIENTLELFARGGFPAIDEFIVKTFPADQQARMKEYFYQIVYGAVNAGLEQGIADGKLADWAPDDARTLFIANSLEAYSGLKEFPAPVLLQLDGFKEIRSSGLQMTRSPGASLVYLGSVLLVLGTIFMFYIREKRAWLLFDQGKIRFAMSSSRNERDLEKEFPEHIRHLEELAKDLNHE